MQRVASQQSRSYTSSPSLSTSPAVRSKMRPWLALLLVLFALNIIFIQAVDRDGDGDDDDDPNDKDGDGIPDSAGLMSPSLPLLLLSVLPVLALRLFGGSA